MDRRAWIVTKINLRTAGILYFVLFNFFMALLISSVIGFFTSTGAGHTAYSGSGQISPTNTLWLLPVLVAIALPVFNFRRIINLGGKRDAFFWGSLLTHLILAGVASLIITVSNFTIEPLLERHDYFDPAFLGGIANIVEVFGWATRGPVVTFIQQFSFLLLLAVFVYTLASVQGKWYGWVANLAFMILVALLAVIPVRAAWGWFFTLILYHPSPLTQIFACLILSAGIYALNKPIYDRRAV